MSEQNDTISRQDAIKALEKFQSVSDVIKNEYEYGRQQMLKTCIYEIEDLPPAQPEIIRCKDCKKYEQRNGNPSGVCTRFGYAYRPDDFCSRAERGE